MSTHQEFGQEFGQEFSQESSRVHDRIIRAMWDYQDLGYSVIFQPRQGELPGFLQSTPPDLLVNTPQEQIATFVTGQRQRARHERCRQANSIIQQQKGWRMDLMVVTEDPLTLLLHEDARPLTQEETREVISAATHLAQLGYRPQAFQSAWSALESAIRLLIEWEQGNSPEGLRTLALLAQAVQRDIIDRQDYFILREQALTKNAISHAHAHRSISQEEIESMVQKAREYMSRIPWDL